MDISTQKHHPISSLLTRFIIGFGSGFIAVIALGIVLFFSWGVVGEYLQNTEDLKDVLGSSIGKVETHTLFLIFIMMAVFISSLVNNLAFAFLSILIEESYTKKTTTFTHIFYGNVFFLVSFFPIYLLVNSVFNTYGILYVALLHLLFTCLFSLFVLQSLHKTQYILIHIYGNLLGILLFLFLGTLFWGSINNFIGFFLAFPLFMGCMGMGHRATELIYAFLYTQTGSDFLHIETTFGSDYGVSPKPNQFDENTEFDNIFKV